GAVAYFPATGKILNLPFAVANKWFAVQDYSILRGNGRLGCPLSFDKLTLKDPTPGSNGLSLTTQDFVRGRIYIREGISTAYTPNVFVDAIKSLTTFANPSSPDGPGLNDRDPMGVTEVGIPVKDPTFDIADVEPTILFQQFARWDYPHGLWNT